MNKHPFVFLRENKTWIVKGALVLFAVISIIVYFADFYHTVYTRFQTCHEIHPLLLCLGLLTATFTTCSFVIILVQFHKHKRGKDYVNLDLDEHNSNVPDLYPLDNNMMSSRLRSVLKWCSHIFTLFLSLLLVAMMIAYASVGSRTLPNINGHLVLQGLYSDATIQREPNGVLHIKANNLHDMYFAQGVAMAQERLWQMEFFRRVGSGTLSAVLGNGTLSVDILFRTLGFWDASIAALGALSKDSLLAVNSFIEGVNSYLDSKPPLPMEFHLLGFKPEPFSPVDAMLMVKILALDLAGNYFREVMYYQLMHQQNLTFERVCELMPEYPLNEPTILNEDDLKHINFTYQFDPITFTRTFTQKSKQTPKSTDTSEKRSNLPKIDVHDLLRQSGVLQGLNLGFKSASNNWVISGNKTRSGKPLLCNDPHLTISAPSIWLMMHLESPNVSVIGVTPVGAPGITIGRNTDIAWGVTNTFADVQDLYILQTNEDGSGYFYNNTWKNFMIRSEVISIKGEEDVTVKVRESLYGPVMTDIVDFQGQTAALRWVQLDDNDTTFDSIIQLSTAKNFDDFRNALRSYVGPTMNFVFADVAGNIGYQCPGRIPVRVPGHTGMIPVPGNGSFDWIGWIPYDELPYVLNPSKGYIVSANNKVVPPSYPYLLGNDHDWDEHFRALSITQLVNSTNNHTLQDMASMQLNTVTGTWIPFKPLISSIPDTMLDEKARASQSLMMAWDGDESVESQCATVFEYWMYYLGRLGSETGSYSWSYPYFILNTLANDTSPECGEGTCLEYIASSFVQAVHAANDRKWGEVHHLMIEHAVMSQSPLACLFDREVRTGGNSFTINLGGFNSRFSESEGRPFNSFVGPSYRQIVDLSSIKQKYEQFVMPMGNSGNLLDPNYDNMLNTYLAGQYYPMRMGNYKVADSVKLK